MAPGIKGMCAQLLWGNAVSVKKYSKGYSLPIVEVRLTDEQRANFQRLAAQKAAESMSAEEWKAVRGLSTDPLRADIAMIFDGSAEIKKDEGQ